MITLDCSPRLAARVRLHYDRHTERHLLLYPERGLALNPSALAIVQLCDGERSVAEIVHRLGTDLSEAAKRRVEPDVLAFLEGLAQRGLLSID